MANEQQRQVLVIALPKSVGISILLTFLFGPLGMLYTTIAGAIVMLVINIFIGIVTLGFGLLLTWPICIIWGAIAANSHNKKLLASTDRSPSASVSIGSASPAATYTQGVQQATQGVDRPKSKTAFCPECGSSVGSDSAFCGECGGKL